MKTRKHLALLLISLVFFSSCSNTPFEFNGDYGIITSQLFRQNGMIWDIDSSGEILGNKKFKLQNVGDYKISDKYFIAGGARKNNNIVIDKKGNIQEVLLLHNKNFTGVTDINIYDDIIVGIMNDGRNAINYHNLLVLQKLDGTVLEQELLDIYAYDSLVLGNKLLIFGENRYNNGVSNSKIIDFNLDTLKINKEIEFEHTANFLTVASLENNFYIRTSDKKYNPNTITILDANYNIIDELNFKEDIADIKEYKGEIYLTFYDRIVKYDKNMLPLKTLELNSEDGEPDEFMLYDNYLHLYTRLYDRLKDKKGTALGYIHKINLDTFEIEKKTKLQFKPDKTVENLIIFPTAFIDK